jgi:hypothetical protein
MIPKPPHIPPAPFPAPSPRALLLAALALTALSCATLHPSPPSPSVFDSGRTAYGFFPAPPKVDFLSGITIYRSIAAHGDTVMIQ